MVKKAIVILLAIALSWALLYWVATVFIQLGKMM